MQDYLESLIARSQQQQLAHERGWRLLLHYRNNLLSNKTKSEVDDPEFFLAPTGKHDPAAELESTLSAFVSEPATAEESRSTQCMFPARYQWLESKLEFDQDLIPARECPSIELWRERINAESVSLVFSSFYFNNPASMFGHTLLRINSADDAKPGLLDFAVSYAAEIDNTKGFFDYAWNGITGGFQGKFSVYPYYDMVKQYNDLENRDLWEYRLNLSPGQIDFMLLHLWELADKYFDFYFLRENCSYHLLSLLEVADPELNFRDRYWAWTLPTETVKQINRQLGLVSGVDRRPSLGSELEKRLHELSDREQDLVKNLLENHAAFESAWLDQVPPARLARIIDTAINFTQYESIADREKRTEQRRKMHRLLVKRSQLQVAGIDIQKSTLQDPVSPDRGHDPVRLEISGGGIRYDEDDNNSAEQSFLDLSIQPGFHDLLSREDGHAPSSQIRYFSLTARYEQGRDDWQLQNFTLVDIVSLSPLSSFLHEPSWKLNIGWELNQDGACSDCTPLVFNPGIGLSLQSSMHRKEVYFGFVEASLEFDHELGDDYRAGLGATVGVLFDVSDQWRLALVAKRTRYTAGQEDSVSKLELNQRYYYSRNIELVFDYKVVEDNHESRLGIAYYF